jgi:hypothetical protein
MTDVNTRRACQFSCGAASAVATKLTLANYPDVVIINAFLKEEDEDNRRFLEDCERWFRHPITIVRDTEYGASTLEVFRRKRFIKGLHGAPCSMLLKRRLLSLAVSTEDIRVIGYTSDEEDRAYDLVENFPDERFEFPLIDYGLDKSDCLALVNDAGIELPRMYRMGYDNANCIGCPKGGQNYWQRIRRDFPERFHQFKIIQEDIGSGANFLRFRSGPRIGERMSLAELPEGDGNLAEEQSFSCSFYCEGAKGDLSQ